jgi:hypothetical protein
MGHHALLSAGFAGPFEIIANSLLQSIAEQFEISGVP